MGFCMPQRISPARSISGSITLPGDKSISHRYAMIASIAQGDSRIQNYSTGADCHSTLNAMRALGVPVEETGTEVVIHGRGLDGLRAPAADIDPLSRMGASIAARDDRFPPLEIRGARLRPIDYPLPVPSAQVKTCVLFAGLYAEGETIVREPVRSRDHTEIALREFGADLRIARKTIALTGRPALTGRDLVVPSDLSSAAFFIVAALLLPGSRLTIRGVGLNPTRSTLLDFLVGMGAAIRITDVESRNGELAGELLVSSSRVRGGAIERETTAALIDEIPVLAVLGAASEEGLTIRDAGELRIKETDRISTVAENLRRMGVQADELPDGLAIPGGQRFHAAELDSFGDHRIAMAFAIAALCADGESVIHGAEAASVSFPEFFETLHQITA